MAVRAQSNGQIMPKSEQQASIQKQQSNEPPAIQMVKRFRKAIEAALPRHVSGDRMLRVVMTAFRATPDLQKCSQSSLIGSILQASQLGLEPNTPLGHCWLLPFRVRGEMTCQLIVGYQGMIDLSMRSGMVSSLYAQPVYEGDVFNYQLGTDPKIEHLPKEASSELTHVYAVARLKGGAEPIFTVMGRQRIDEARSRSKSSKAGPWVTDYDAMAMKTAVRRLWKWLPKTPEMATSLALDEVTEQERSQALAWDGAVLEAVNEAQQSGAIESSGEPVDPAAGSDGHAEPGAEG